MTRHPLPSRGIRAGVRRLFSLPVRTDAMARADADAELETYLAARIEHFAARGMTPDEARAEALRRLGGPLREVRATLRSSAERREGRKQLRDSVDDLWQDIRYAARGIARRPAFAAAAVLCLAIGIGANATMFGVVDALLLRPPSGVRDPGSLVWINTKSTTPEGGFGEAFGVSIPDYADFARSPALAGAAFYSRGDLKFGRGGDAQRINALFVNHTFMPLLGASPVLGRFFGANEDVDDAPQIVVLGYAFWQSHFAGAADVIGKTVLLDDKLYSVAGVAPRDFNGVGRSIVDLYLPPVVLADMNRTGGRRPPLTDRSFNWFSVVGRMRPGVRRERFAETLNAIYHNADTGDKERGRTSVVVASPTSMAAMNGAEQVQNATVSLWLYGVAGIVLLIACANVAGLLLTRAVGRRREIAVRLALGIGRGRLVRLLMTESVLLAGAGCVAGLVLARWGGSVIRTTLLFDTDAGSARLDSRVLGVTLLTTVLTGLVCGLAPAVLATRPNLTRVLKSGERDGTEGRGRVGSALLVSQVALTLVLLVGAGLFVRSVRNLDAIDFGLDVRHVLRAYVGDPAYAASEADQYFRRLLERARALPGVERAALASAGPFSILYVKWISVPGYEGESGPLLVPGHESEGGQPPNLNAVTPEFFSTLGMALRSGRGFTMADKAGTERVAIVNEAMARFYWPRGDALGKCIRINGIKRPCTTIVGIVHTVRQGNWLVPVQNEQPISTYYIPFDQRDSTTSDRGRATLYVRSAGDAALLVPGVQRTIQTISPNSPPADVMAFSTRIARQFRPWRLGATMFAIFGGIALGLAIVGLYGVLAFRVTQRTHEIGVRVALGAQREDVRRLVVGQGLRLAAIGVTIGFGASLATAPLLDPLLFHVSAKDPRVLVTMGGALLVVALLASYVPAARATRIDPLDALREL